MTTTTTVPTSTTTTCEQCGTAFTSSSRGRRARYCGPTCRSSAHRAAKRAERDAEPWRPRQRACHHCGEVFMLASTGRPRRWCSDRCRVAGNRAHHVLPYVMRERDTWTARHGKRPVMVDGSPASSTNPATWTTFEDVADVDNGIMLGGGLGVLDLDHCLDSRGTLAPWAQQVVDALPFPIVWTERSMSGEGLHVFVLAPEGPGRRRGGVESYTKARFVAVSGDEYTL